MGGAAKTGRLAALVRILKILALLGFLLPWFTMSCAGKTFVSPHGYELALGLKIEAGDDFSTTASAPPLVQAASLGPPASMIEPITPPVARNPARAAPDIIQWLAAGAGGLLVLALAVGVWLRGEAFLAAAAGAGFAAAGLAWASVAAVEMEVRRAMIEMARQSPVGAMAVAQLDIQIRMEPGLWLTVLAAGFAAVLASFGLWRSQRPSAKIVPGD